MRRYKVKEVIKLLEADGWVLFATKAIIGNLSIPRDPEKLRFGGSKVKF